MYMPSRISERCSILRVAAPSIDLSEEASRRPLGSLDFVKRSIEWHPPAGQRSQIRDPFHDHDSCAENHAVHREIFRTEIGKPGAILLEEIEADRLRVFGHEPLGRL